MSKQNILITGGTGYIGSHTVVEMLKGGYDVIIVDNFSNSEPEVLDRIKRIASDMAAQGEIVFYEGDVCGYEFLSKIFDENNLSAAIHFAGYKAVGESVEKPLDYYQNNLQATMNLMRVMKEYHVNNLIFSSSATVYGMNNQVPFDETMPTSCTNPYGWTKLMSEQILMDQAAADPEFTPVLLRYFNPIGAHESGLIGENPRGIPNNLMPYIQQVAVGKREKLGVFGDDYDTADGTGVRDYIHVVDLAIGHVKALDYAFGHKGAEVFNLGTGKGYSVLDVVNTFSRVNNVSVPYEIMKRRPGDIASCYANASKAEKVLGWKAEKSLDEMCSSAWNWEKNIR